MAVKLNHTIVHSKDKVAAARFVTEIFGLPAPKPFYHFLDVELSNEVTLAEIITRPYGDLSKM